MDKIAKLKTYWQVAQGEWSDWIQRAKKSFAFYRGEQWDLDVKQELQRLKKPALTFNKIKPIIHNLSGWQRQNRQDLRVLPRQGGSKPLADFWTELLKYFYDISLAQYKLSQQFVDGVVCGKGWVALDIDYTKDPLNGELLLKKENPLLVFEDPHSQHYDLSDAKFIIRCYWMDKDEVLMNFPKAKKDIEFLSALPATEKSRFGIETKDYTETPASFISEIEKFRYLVKEFWWKEFKEKKLIINRNTLEIQETDETDEKLQAIVNQFPFLTVVRRVMPVLNLTTMVGDIVLQDIKDPFGGVSLFPLVRFSPNYSIADKTYIKGEVDDLIDPQMEINKRRSQVLHILNTSPNSGWIIEEGALDAVEQKRLENMGSMPGIVINVKPGKRIEKISPPQLSDGHITLERLSEDDLRKISGVNTDLLGYKGEQQLSGIAMQYRRQAGLLTCEPIFDNFEYTQLLLGETLLELIRKTDVFSDEEILKIIDTSKIEGFSPDLMKSRALGRYQLVLTTSSTSQTIRMQNFLMLIEAVKAGLPISPEIIVEASDLPYKEVILEEIRKQKGLQATSITGNLAAEIPENMGASSNLPEGF